MRVAFRVEGNPCIGLGHLMRCMALAQALVQLEHKVFFFMSPDSAQFCQNRPDWLGDVHIIDKVANQSKPQWLVKQVIDLQADWLVLDGYQYGKTYRRALKSAKYKLAVFDDINDSGALYADMVINGAPSSTLLDYQSTAPNALLALGQDYQVLRQEFLHGNKDNWLKRHNLTLMFGGSDPKKLTISVLSEIQKSKPSLPITVITGAAFTGVQELEKLIKSSDLDVTHLHDCQNIADVILNSKLALSAAGGSQFELRACAVPAILVVVAENQLSASQDAANQGWCQVVTADELNADQLAKKCISLWQQPEKLHTMHKMALLFPVVDGAKNVATLMSDKILTSADSV